MLRKALTLGMVFIFALSLLAVSMITCFTYDAEAHDLFWCVNHDTGCEKSSTVNLAHPWCCNPMGHHHTGE